MDEAAENGDGGSGTGNRREPDAEGDDDDDDDETAGERQPDMLDRVVSRVMSRSSYELSAPPDGGWLAWSQCTSSSRLPLSDT